MHAPAGYIVQVTGLSPIATEKHVYDFFGHCGVVQNVEIIGYGELARTAYVTFADAYAMETAVLLSGAVIIDQRVCITPWGISLAESDHWSSPSMLIGDDTSSIAIYKSQYIPAIGSTVTLTQEVVKPMLATGYILAKDALAKAKAFDESHRVSATAAVKFVQISKSAAAFTGRAAVAAAKALANTTYFARGAQWVSGALARAAVATAEIGNKKRKLT